VVPWPATQSDAPATAVNTCPTLSDTGDAHGAELAATTVGAVADGVDESLQPAVTSVATASETNVVRRGIRGPADGGCRLTCFVRRRSRPAAGGRRARGWWWFGQPR